MSEKADMMVCFRKQMMPVPNCPARVLTCLRCGADVWVAEGFCRQQVDSGVPPVCVECALPEIEQAKADGKPVEHMLTPNQMDDLDGLLTERDTLAN